MGYLSYPLRKVTGVRGETPSKKDHSINGGVWGGATQQKEYFFTKSFFFISISMDTLPLFFWGL